VGSGESIRVAITVGPAGHGGIATYCRELITALGRRNDVELVLIGPSGEIAAARAELSASPGERADSRTTGRGDVVVRGPRSLTQLRIALISVALRRRAVDVVHVTRMVAPLRWPGRVVMTFHDDYPLTRRSDYDQLKRRLLPPIFRRSLRRAGVVVTLDADMAERATRYTRSGVPVIDAGAAVSTRLATADEQRPHDGVPQEPFAIVVGDAGPRKGVDAMVRRWGEVTEACRLRLVLIGARAASGSLVDAVAADPQVSIVSDVSDTELAWWYRHAQMVVDPSVEEGFGFPRVEAAHFATPYLAVRLLPVGTDWVDALVELRRHGATSVDVAGAVTDEVADVMSWDEVAQRTVEAYRLAMAPGSG
jgi:glycosyltransferase involved in cell wall biosynthesis